MNILVIGNGFDLAHDLPTKYSDFLHFIKVAKDYANIFVPLAKSRNYVEAFSNISTSINDLDRFSMGCYNYFFHLSDKYPVLFNEIYELSIDNIWINYFMYILDAQDKQSKTGWIDFESEISGIIQMIDKLRKVCALQLKELGKSDYPITYTNYKPLFDLLYRDYSKNDSNIATMDLLFRTINVVYPDHIIIMKNDILSALNALIRCLEIYLSDFVQKLAVSPLSDIKALDIDKVLSFNYTDTANRLYCRSDGSAIDYDYIHGKADISHSIETCNMVLGIDEYLPMGERDSDNEFIEFKKFYQRIYKQTGSHYMDWIEQRREKNRQLPEGQEPEGMNVYIYGHSLDVTDRDILRDLILEEGAITTIFYYNKRDLGQKIANLVKVIGEDELIKRTGGQNKSIIFKETTKES